MATKHIALTFVIFLLLFIIAPLPGGDDWLTLTLAAKRLASGQPLYGIQDPYYYANPPHLAMLLIPVAYLPYSLALLQATSLTLTLALLMRWCPEDALLKFILTLFSPPMLYILLHGEIDVLILGGVLLPPSLWVLVAITKPQVAIGLVLHIPRRQWVIAGATVIMVFVLTWLLLGAWWVEWLKQSHALVNYGHNLWGGLWPFQVPLGVFLCLQGLKYHDERYSIAGSPFCSPYATIGSLIGVWLVGLSFLNRWQAVLLWGCWWGVVVIRIYS